MTPRQRFRETMRYGRPDRVPFLEEGLRDDVLERWQEQGLAAGADLAAMFGYDRRERISLNLGLRPPLKKWPTSRRGLGAYRRRLDPDDPDRLGRDWPARVAAWAQRDAILELPVHSGLFLTMGVEDWSRLSEVLYQLVDQPGLIGEMLEIHGHFVARVLERVLREVEVDFATFSEPIGGNDGPMLSPRMYEQVVLAGYRPILEVLRRHGVETIVYLSYANPRPLLPSVVEAGFNCLWACEASPKAMDYRDLRRQFGRSLRLIGGIDLDTLLADESTIRSEILAKVPPLLADGGYIPLADGRVRVDIPFESYRCYRRTLEEVVQEGRAR